jgi:hypothetical protein
MPVQHFDLGSLAVDEHIQSTAKGVEPQALLNHHTQPIDLLSKVNRRAAKIDVFD